MASNRCKRRRVRDEGPEQTGKERPEITPGELETCRCSMYKRLPAFFTPDVEHARCYECVKPIKDCSEVKLQWFWLVRKACNKEEFKCFF